MNDLNSEVPIVEQNIASAERKIALIDSVYHQKLPPERLKNCYECISVHAYYQTLSLPSKGYRMLAAYAGLNQSLQDSLVHEILEFYVNFESANRTQEEVRRLATRENVMWAMNDIGYTLGDWYKITNEFTTDAAITQKSLSSEGNLKRMLEYQSLVRADLLTLRFFVERGADLKRKIAERFR